MHIPFSFTKVAGALSLALAASAVPTVASANADATTKIVVGFAPGGALDTFARTLAEKLRGSLGGIVLVENKPGASARLALDAVKRAAPDGKTILIAAAPSFTIFPLTYKRLPYDPDKDLIPVAHLADVPMVVSTSVTQPYKTMPEYMEWVKRNPKSIAFGVVALGGPAHFGVSSLSNTVGVQLAPTAYRGGAMMLTDEIGGILPISIDAVASKMEHYKAGKIRFLGVTGTKRTVLLPDVPTLKEVGTPGFELASGWYSAFVPAGTPPATVARLEKALIDAAKDEGVRVKMAGIGMETTGYPGSELRKIILEQRAKWKPVVEASGFTAEE